jgi:HSP20 family protein
VVGRRDPLQDLLNLQERINRLFEESLGRGRAGEAGSFGSGTWAPLADVYETEQAFFILLELPGLERADVEVLAEGKAVTVKGQRRLAASARPESFYRMERSYGSFARAFQFAETIDPDRVDARFEEGLLRLEVPKARPRSEWRVRVEHAD